MNGGRTNDESVDWWLSAVGIRWIVVGICALWVTIPGAAIVVLHRILKEGSAAELGDSFGIVNALFSGLALAGVVLAVLLQSRELKLQREELALTRTELERSAGALAEQVTLMQLSAKLAAIPGLIDQQKRRIAALAGEDFPDIVNGSYSIEDMEDMISAFPAKVLKIEREISSLDESIESLKVSDVPHLHLQLSGAKKARSQQRNRLSRVRRSASALALLLSYTNELEAAYKDISNRGRRDISPSRGGSGDLSESGAINSAP